jgi:NAD(P)-dependent dehydrogenase (short-subunit alcohol dehydrogenase family)
MQASLEGTRKMHINLSGKTALVTNSTAGIGFAIAKGLTGARVRIVVNGRTRERVDLALGESKAMVMGASPEGAVADASTAAGSSRCPATQAEALPIH